MGARGEIREVRRCFACINSGEDFRNFFGEILGGYEKLYVVKGGPGTGKSGLLRALAEEAERRGERAIRIFCSSDPKSLDGVLLPERSVAAVDGTAPHEAAERIPGVTSELVNLGAFWDGKALEAQKEKISALNAAKGGAFGRAYALLAAAKRIAECEAAHLKPGIDEGAFAKRAAALLKDAPKSGRPEKAEIAPMASLGMEGAVRLDGFEECSEMTVSVERLYGAGLLFAKALKEEAERAGVRVCVSPDPVTLLPESVYLPDAGLLLRVRERDAAQTGKTVALRRYVALPEGAELRALRTLEKEVRALTAQAAEELRGAKSAHFALERIYGGAMDFSGVDGEKERLLKEIFNS